ncbi:APC family permease [Lentzea sp. NPDC058450]|uniref:APC family permease n=1 Tax=Lentzea sp. NPDC058450 TaxID=3346505 RepID=UPI0036633809
MAVDEAEASSGGSLKRNSISTLGIVVLVLSVGSPLIGLTGSVPSAMVTGNGLGVPLAYLAVGAILLLFSVGFVAMSRQVVNGGAMYAYVGRGLGLRMGLGAAGLAVWAYTMLQIAVYGFFGTVLTGAFKQWWGVQIPWWLATLCLVALVQVFGYLKIEIGAWVLIVVMACEWSIMLLMAAVILVRGGAGQGFAAAGVWSPSHLVGAGAGVAIMWAIASMAGFENAAIYGEEVRDPRKSVPRASIISILMITGFFGFTSWMLIVGYGPAHAIDAALEAVNSGDPAQYVFRAGENYLGAWAPHVMTIFVITSMFACCLAFHNGISRYSFALARDRVLPQFLARTNRHGSPHLSSFLQTATVLVLLGICFALGSDPVLVIFFWGSGVAVVGLVCLYVLVAIAILVHFRRNPQADVSVWRTLVAPAASAVVMVLLLCLIIANFEVLIATTRTTALLIASTVIVAFLLGVVVYSLRKRSLNPRALAELSREVM